MRISGLRRRHIYFSRRRMGIARQRTLDRHHGGQVAGPEPAAHRQFYSIGCLAGGRSAKDSMHRPGRRHQVLGAKYHPSTQRPAEVLKAEQCRRSRQPCHDGRSMPPGWRDRLAPQRSHVPLRHRMYCRTSGGESGTECTRLGVSIINQHHWESGPRRGERIGGQGRADHHGQRRPDRALQEFTSVSQAKPCRAY